MSLQWELNREVPDDTLDVGQHVLKRDNFYRMIGDRFDELFPNEQEFAEMYAPTGRGAISPLLLALVTVFQQVDKAPDRTAAEFVAARIDWKYALHLPLKYTGFHFTDLSAFRKRLLENEHERLLFERLLSRLMELGWVKQRGKLRTDSTHLLGAVARLSQLELVAESLRVALLAVRQLAADWVATHLPEAFQETYTERLSAYGLSQAKVRQRLKEVGRDGFWFLHQLETQSPDFLAQLPEVRLLRQVLEQEFPGGPGQPPNEKHGMGSEIIDTPHDPDARFAIKRGQGWLGYKLQLSETCDEELPRLVVDAHVTGALDNDSPELPQIQERIQAQGLSPQEQYVDQGYMSGQHLVASAEQGIRLMGKPLADTQGPPDYRQTDFEIDVDAQQATCPQERSSQVWSQRTDGAILIRFQAGDCQACPAFGTCTQSAQGRSLTLHPHRLALLKRRQEAQTAEFKQQMNIRSGVEASISELKRGYGGRRGRYRVQAKLQLEYTFKVTAMNLKRLMRWIAKHGSLNTASLRCADVSHCS